MVLALLDVSVIEANRFSKADPGWARGLEGTAVEATKDAEERSASTVAAEIILTGDGTTKGKV